MAKYCRMSERPTKTQASRPMRLSFKDPVVEAMGRLAERRGHKWGNRWNRSKLVAALVEQEARKEGVW